MVRELKLLNRDVSDLKKRKPERVIIKEQVQRSLPQLEEKEDEDDQDQEEDLDQYHLDKANSLCLKGDCAFFGHGIPKNPSLVFRYPFLSL
jgi:hypothetical protein